jgi:Cu(I)/Ag(I) efflux system protein CusF
MKLNRLVAALGLTAAFGALAQTAPAPATDHAAHHPVSAASAAPTTDGEVRRIDKEQGKVTLRHGPIANLDMPGMTMVFKVANTKMLDTLKEGDKVRFAADRINGAITVTAIEAAK